MAEEENVEEAKPSSSKGFIAGFAIVTVIAAGVGWFLGGQFFANSKTMEMQASQEEVVQEDEKNKAEKEGDSEEEEKVKAEGNPVVRLEPIIVGLKNSGNSFLRLELAIITDEQDDLLTDESKLRLVDAISTFSKTLSMRNISGPSGYLHFREDILDVARATTKGIVKDVLILSMVAE